MERKGERERESEKAKLKTKIEPYAESRVSVLGPAHPDGEGASGRETIALMVNQFTLSMYISIHGHGSTASLGPMARYDNRASY